MVSWFRGCIRASLWSAGSGAASEHRFGQLVQGLHHEHRFGQLLQGAASEHRFGQLVQGLHQSIVLVSWFRGCIRASFWSAGSGAASEHRFGQLVQGLHHGHHFGLLWTARAAS